MPRNALQESARMTSMTPATRATLSDLLDRVLDRGLILDADLVIVLAGIPLIGVKLRAAIAGMETMCRYGLMVDWDRRIREEHRETQAPRLTHTVKRQVPHGLRSR